MGGDVGRLTGFPANGKFQSTPPYGGRHEKRIKEHQAEGFQSTPPYGGRLVNDAKVVTGNLVSIHAPVWGATSQRKQKPNGRKSFNPRPRMGGDSKEIAVTNQVIKFQSTPPYGGRLWAL